MNKKIFRRKELPIVVVLLIFSAYATFESWKIFIKNTSPEKAGFYPLLVSAGMCICCILSLLELRFQYKNLPEEPSPEGDSWKSVMKSELPFPSLLMALLSIGYVILFKWIGFYAATGIFLMVTISIMGKSRGRAIFTNLCITAGSLLTVWLVMEHIFSIHLSM